MAERPPPDEGLCVAICTLEAPPSLGRILRVVATPAGPCPPTEVLLVHGEDVRTRLETVVRETGRRVPVRGLVVGSRGFSIDRRSALEWASEHRAGWSVLFLDDDDVPQRELIPRLWDAHLERPHDIVAGAVVAHGAPAPANATGLRPVAYHGASTMLIPGRLVRDRASWLPRWVDHCGGEDTALCAEAGRCGVRIWEVQAAVAHAVKPNLSGLGEYEARRALHEGWVFSFLCRCGVIPGWRASAPLGHPNRCYAWTGELSWGVAAAISICLKPGDVFLDIGAFTGQHTIRAATLVGERGRVIAVEPDQRCVYWMRANLSAADLSSRVVLIEAAAVPAGQAGGTTTLHLSPMVSMSSVLATPNAAGVMVPAVSIEELLTTHRPNLVKIDVEGFEAELLRGSPALQATRAPTLVIEANPGAVEQAHALGYETLDLVEAASARDRRLLNLSEDVLAYKPGALDAGDFVQRYRDQLGRLRRLPRVEFLRRRSGPAS